MTVHNAIVSHIVNVDQFANVLRIIKKKKPPFKILHYLMKNIKMEMELLLKTKKQVRYLQKIQCMVIIMMFINANKIS